MSDTPASEVPAPVQWYKVAELDDLQDGRVRTVTTGTRSLALTRVGDRYGALDNHCPHQGGPLGEGSIEKGMLRCPWHGYDYDPLTGTPPPGFSDAPSCFPVDVRDDGIYVGLEDEPDPPRTVSDVMVETMVNWGVTHVFGMVGHSNLGFADAMRRRELAGDLTFVGIRHEGAAAFAASAYGKLTGRPAACFAIAGPGSTNLLTGLYDAKVDRAPVLAISGQVPSNVLGRGRVPGPRPLRGVLRRRVVLEDRAAHVRPRGADGARVQARTRRSSCRASRPARRGAGATRRRRRAGSPRQPVASATTTSPRRPSRSQKQSRSSERARRPVIVVGHGARFDMPEVISLAEQLHAPVFTTFKAKGQISDRHPLGAGVLGRSGTPVASWLMNESDLIVVFGASFSNHTGIAAYKPIIQVDFEPMALGRFHPVTVPLLGHVGITARLLAQQTTSGSARIDQSSDVSERWGIWREEKRRRLADDRGSGVSSAAVFDTMSRLVPDDAIIAVDVGNHAYSFGRYFECTRQTVLMSGYLGSIGFGFPAAMGAWAAAPERPILAVTGDGGFGQYLAELTTAVKYGMNITHVLLDNSSLGKISKEQRAAHFAVWQTSLHNPDFARVRAALWCARRARRRPWRPRRRPQSRPRARRPSARPRRH